MISSALAQTPRAETNLLTADSLLRQGDYAGAAVRYEKLANRKPAPGILLRLAYAREQEGRIPDALWALRRTYERRPDRAILRKMDALGSAYHLPGHEYGDRRFFFTIMRRYYRSLIEAGLFAGVLLATFLVIRARQRNVRRPWGGVLLVYSLMGALVVNLLSPDRLSREVLVRRPTALMSGPSGGARWLTTLVPGQQLPVTGELHDIWVPVRWQGKAAWVRTGALYQTFSSAPEKASQPEALLPYTSH